MFSVNPISTQPFSENGRRARIYFDLQTDIEASFAFILYVATKQFATLPADTLRSQPFRGVLKSYQFTRSIVGSQIGAFVPGQGNLVISNEDAFYDFLPQYYTFDARPININVTQDGASFNGAFPLARLVGDAGSNVDINSVNVQLRDYGYLLDVPMQPNLYGGAGGVDGGSDLAGQRKPLVFGSALNVTPPQINTSLLIYQVNDGSVQDIVAVYDRGVSITKGADFATYAALAAATVTAATYATCKAQGYFRLGSSPTSSNTVTADVQGDNRDGYLVRTADLVRWAIRNRTQIADPSGLDVPSFETVNSIQPAPVAYWIGPEDSIMVSEFIGNLMGGIGGWGGHRRDGLYEVRIFTAPAGEPVQRFTRDDFLGDNEPERSPLPGAYTPPPWRWRVPYARSWTVQTDIAGSVSAAHRSFVAEPYRLGSASNAAVKVDHPTAQDPDPIQAFFANGSDATAEAQRRLDLFKASRTLYSATLPRRALRLNLGDVALLTVPRFDLSVGKLMAVVGMQEMIDFSSDKIDSVKVVLYG